MRQKDALINLTPFKFAGLGFKSEDMVMLVYNVLQREKNKIGRKIKLTENAKVIASPDSFAMIDEVWSVPEEEIEKHNNFKGCFDKIRRETTPKCYEDLAAAVNENFEKTRDHVVHYTRKKTTGSVSVKSTTTEGASTVVVTIPSIFDHQSKTYSRAHLIGKAPEFAFYYGLPAEGVVGIPLGGTGEEQIKRQLLVYGVEEIQDLDDNGERKITQAIQGLRDRKDENMLVVNSQHLEYLDTLTKGKNVVVLPVCDLDFIKNWQQGQSYDVLVVGSNDATYAWMAVDSNTRGIQAATPEEIQLATRRANEFAEGLLDLLINDEFPMPLGDPTSEEQKKTVEEIKAKGRHMENARNHIKNKKFAKLPVALEGNERGDVLKVALQEWPCDVYPDPYLVALKGAINLYYQGSGDLKHKLFPTCSDFLSRDDDSITSSEGSWYIPLSLVPKDVDVNIVTDDDEDIVSDVSDN